MGKEKSVAPDGTVPPGAAVPGAIAPSSIDEYIGLFSGEIRERLEKIRETIRRSAPDAVEKISWAMPTFRQKENLIHFAAQKKHIGLYPGAEAVAAFAADLETYVTSKGAIQLPYNKPLPLGLITKIVRYRVKRVNGKINNPAASSGVCCLGKVFASGFNTFLTAPRGGVSNPSHTMKTE